MTMVIKGARAISEAVGINWKRFDYFRREKGLPTWRHDGGGIWLALHEDLENWIRRQRDLNLKK